MFPDISLLCGTTAPEGVPSLTSKTSSAFAQAFSDLLGLVDMPASTGASTSERSVAAEPMTLDNAPVETPAAAEPQHVAVAPFLPAADVAVYAEPLRTIGAEQADPPVETGATSKAVDKRDDEREEDLPVLAAVVPFQPLVIPDSDPLPAPFLAKEPDVDPADETDHAPESTRIAAPRSQFVTIEVPPDFAVESKSVAEMSTVIDETPTPRATNADERALNRAVAPVVKLSELPREAPDSPNSIAALRRAAAQAQGLRTEAPRRPSIELPRHVIEPSRGMARLADADRTGAVPTFSEAEPVPQPALATPILEAIIGGGSIQRSPTSPTTAPVPEQVAKQDLEALMASAKSGGSDAGPSPAFQINVPALKPAFAAILNAAGQTRPAQVTLPNEAATAQSIVQTLRLQAANGGGTAVITLTPKYLGAVTVSLRVSEGAVTATLQAENASVRTWMEANAPLLKEGLADRGLTLTEMVVAEPYEQHRQTEDQPRRHADERGPTRRFRRREESSFEVVV